MFTLPDSYIEKITEGLEITVKDKSGKVYLCMPIDDMRVRLNFSANPTEIHIFASITESNKFDTMPDKLDDVVRGHRHV